MISDPISNAVLKVDCPCRKWIEQKVDGSGLQGMEGNWKGIEPLSRVASHVVLLADRKRSCSASTQPLSVHTLKLVQTHTTHRKEALAVRAAKQQC